jgi:RAB protein geranylgeranyltransferase component A
VAAFIQSSVTLARSLTTNPLLSTDDKSRLVRYLKGIQHILRDLQQRSKLSEGKELSRDSSDYVMLQMLKREKDEVTAYAGNMVDVAQRLWLNNRLSEKRYEELKRLYKSVLAAHDELRVAMEAARESGT